MARVALVLIVSLQLALGAKKAEDPQACEGASHAGTSLNISCAACVLPDLCVCLSGGTCAQCASR